PVHLECVPCPRERVGGLRLGRQRRVASTVATGAIRSTRGRGRRRRATLACTVSALRGRRLGARLLPGVALGRRWRRHLASLGRWRWRSLPTRLLPGRRRRHLATLGRWRWHLATLGRRRWHLTAL